MTRRIVFAVACFALLTALAGPAWADAISFSFVGLQSTTPVGLNQTGVSLKSAELTTITSSNSNIVHDVPGTVGISTGPASPYVAGSFLMANFGPGSGTEVEVDSASCTGGLQPGVCLKGSLNGLGATGFFVAFQGGTGAFQGSFHVDYVSPFVTSLFGLPNIWQQPGSDSFIVSNNSWVPGGSTDSGILGAGDIIFQDVPEPGTMVLLGTGLIGLAALVRLRKPR